ncbi:MAG: hypothetical protein FGM15_11350 [Chthoniobacterales bacterium]|nr:hypothetical protein [Chthoniobacterales bacterium]
MPLFRICKSGEHPRKNRTEPHPPRPLASLHSIHPKPNCMTVDSYRDRMARRLLANCLAIVLAGTASMHAGAAADTPSLSMTLDGRPVRMSVPLRELPADAKAADESASRSITLAVPDSDLEIRLEGWYSPESGTAYYVPFLANKGTKASALIEKIRSLDVEVSVSGDVHLHHAKGSTAAPDDFLPQSETMEPNATNPHLELLFEDASGGVSRHRSWRGTPFQLGEKTYANGLAFNSTKHFRVVLGRPAERFTAEVGLENNDDTRQGAQSGNGSVTFHVLVDGKEVASTPVLRLKDGAHPLDVPLNGASEFEIRVKDGGDGRAWDQALLADARIHLKDGDTVALQDLPVAPRVFGPLDGRSSSGQMPFFNLEWRGGGLVMAVGWTGQWQATFDRPDSNKVTATAGLPYASLSLLPGETIRLPSILLVPWKGEDWQVGQNALRRVLLDRFSPRLQGELVMPPVAHATSAALHLHDGGWAGGNEKTQMDAIAAIGPLGVEAYWLDAYWFPGAFPNGVGNWFYRKNDFPRGLRPLGDAAHERGMKFILWFEPERVGPDTELERQHPEWLLGSPGTSRLLNLGIPEARKHMTDVISRILTETKADVYRQDFNIEPLPLWRAADPPGRQGMTEIRHVEGLYAMWDELRSRHAGLWIDNCASGGRRIDIETLSRSLPLWRSDTPDHMIWHPKLREQSGAADQVQTAGLSLWAPLHSGGVWDMDPYRFRSAMQAGVVLYDDPRQPTFPAAQAKLAFEEVKSLRPFFTGDYYLLKPLSGNEDDWCAYQYHRPDLGAGFAIVFRRQGCTQDNVTIQLRDIDPAERYAVSWHGDYPAMREETMTGQSLKDLTISVPTAPGSVLIRYALEKRR